ncbi:MAG: 2-alkenal reductase [Candidatus Gottesmanbacteria bacterium GW2011_GWA2_43_14]|uniref:2-alkenal reductase n=1 Tax=Candidatus Gottesmanbacteria bacterium GW2011_GWA2_43_14 TaxID=1618443 RepID=A0A0G1FRI4_9BACT|nr:MAG: 2-alkenal reductase [Candidatus Gottesmanbacteria bacterium GW2011_GWA2_43_14]
MKRLLVLIALFLLLIFIGSSGRNLDFSFGTIGNLFKSQESQIGTDSEKIRIITEESVITSVVDKVSPSVVTVSVVSNRSLGRIFDDNPFDPFDMFRQGQSQQQRVEQDIGTGFIVSEDGLIVTNKHVVSDTDAKYRVITHDDKSHDVEKVYRDPTNDLAIIKIADGDLSPVEIGDSSKIKVGQLAIAIGTALGEFRNTVTVGVISGLGRGITAGSPFEGFVERLDNVIQTDAAINPGNSGGPLLNSAGQVVGMNVAVSAEGQNIGFALPIGTVKEVLDQFQKSGGRFERPYLGVRYKMITRDLALLNEVPEGAYIQEVIEDSPADNAGVRVEDIITKIDNQKVTENDGGLARIIAAKKIGDRTALEVWRNGDSINISVTIGESSGE